MVHYYVKNKKTGEERPIQKKNETYCRIHAMNFVYYCMGKDKSLSFNDFIFFSQNSKDGFVRELKLY